MQNGVITHSVDIYIYICIYIACKIRLKTTYQLYVVRASIFSQICIGKIFHHHTSHMRSLKYAERTATPGS